MGSSTVVTSGLVLQPFNLGDRFWARGSRRRYYASTVVVTIRARAWRSTVSAIAKAHRGWFEADELPTEMLRALRTRLPTISPPKPEYIHQLYRRRATSNAVAQRRRHCGDERHRATLRKLSGQAARGLVAT